MFYFSIKYSWICVEVPKDQLIFTQLRLKRNTFKYHCKCQVSIYAHSTVGLHIIMCAHTLQNKPIEAILALHTPRPTTHTECLWEHLWCERWRTKSSGWVWFSSPPRAPFLSHRRACKPGSLTHSLPYLLLNIPPTLQRGHLRFLQTLDHKLHL